ncbi:hypothetical protein K435DRAFT_807501 [Dendrothele bispora CBS 962.96]|uniref:Uncharacterized protein n=1 Tax=Dendrothele bispora (strain CBS 962.96) TaxID=1314807 RepID=A0A4S8L531_DENBC|nr:hypothetical protein K435DRAFT_807501 [Dendrothele bispora CBS 962.96]
MTFTVGGVVLVVALVGRVIKVWARVNRPLKFDEAYAEFQISDPMTNRRLGRRLLPPAISYFLLSQKYCWLLSSNLGFHAYELRRVMNTERHFGLMFFSDPDESTFTSDTTVSARVMWPLFSDLPIAVYTGLNCSRIKPKYVA